MSVQPSEYDVAAIMGGLYGDGIIALKGAFSTGFADSLYQDMMQLFEEARQVPGGVLPRGPQRWYVETQPERIRGFVEIIEGQNLMLVRGAVPGPKGSTVEVRTDA